MEPTSSAGGLITEGTDVQVNKAPVPVQENKPQENQTQVQNSQQQQIQYYKPVDSTTMGIGTTGVLSLEEPGRLNGYATREGIKQSMIAQSEQQVGLLFNEDLDRREDLEAKSLALIDKSAAINAKLIELGEAHNFRDYKTRAKLLDKSATHIEKAIQLSAELENTAETTDANQAKRVKLKGQIIKERALASINEVSGYCTSENQEKMLTAQILTQGQSNLLEIYQSRINILNGKSALSKEELLERKNLQAAIEKGKAIQDKHTTSAVIYTRKEAVIKGKEAATDYMANLRARREFLKKNPRDRELFRLKQAPQEATEPKVTLYRDGKPVEGEYNPEKDKVSVATPKYRVQNTANGCWSVSMSNVMGAFGVPISQGAIRAYKPVVNNKPVGYDGLDDEAKLRALRERKDAIAGLMRTLNGDNMYSMAEQGALVMDVMKNVRLYDIKLTPYTASMPPEDQAEAREDFKKELQAAQEKKIREILDLGIRKCHSPISMCIASRRHVVTVTGFDAKNIYYKDSAKSSVIDDNPDAEHTMTIEDLAKRGELQFNFLRKISLNPQDDTDDKLIEGLSDITIADSLADYKHTNCTRKTSALAEGQEEAKTQIYMDIYSPKEAGPEEEPFDLDAKISELEKKIEADRGAQEEPNQEGTQTKEKKQDVLKPEEPKTEETEQEKDKTKEEKTNGQGSEEPKPEETVQEKSQTKDKQQSGAQPEEEGENQEEIQTQRNESKAPNPEEEDSGEAKTQEKKSETSKPEGEAPEDSETEDKTEEKQGTDE